MSKKQNKLAYHDSDFDKVRDFNAARSCGEVAYFSNGNTVSLNAVKLHDVEFIGGLWRFQDKFPYKIQDVRGESFVLFERLPRIEKNHFEFYRAQRVSQNCYGYYMVGGPSQIVAKYATDQETYWAYGNSIEQARAFLGIKLYDKFSDLIHSVVCQKTHGRSEK